jgi:hypothetical protein
MPGDFNYSDFSSTYPSPAVQSFPEILGNLQPIQPNPSPVYPHAVPQQQNQYGQPAPLQPNRRPSEPHGTPAQPLSLEEESRAAAEEDKRRRNTAASARFRVKKKAREQALEKSAKEMTDKVTALENRITLLETENRWLKNLVMEKNGSSKDVSELFREMNSKQAAENPASGGASATSSESSKDEK